MRLYVMRLGEKITKEEAIRLDKEGAGTIKNHPAIQFFSYIPSEHGDNRHIVIITTEVVDGNFRTLYTARSREDLIVDPNNRSVRFVEDKNSRFFLKEIGKRITPSRALQIQNSGAGKVFNDPSGKIFAYNPSRTNSPHVLIVSNGGFYLRDVKDLEVDSDGKGVHFAENPERSYAFHPKRDVA